MSEVIEYVDDPITITDQVINRFASVVEDEFSITEIVVKFPYDEWSDVLTVNGLCPQVYTDLLSDTVIILDNEGYLPSYIRDDNIDFIYYEDEFRQIFSDTVEDFITVTDKVSSVIFVFLEDTITVTDETSDHVAKLLNDTISITNAVRELGTFHTRINDGTGRIRDGTTAIIHSFTNDVITITDDTSTRSYHPLSDTMIVLDTVRQFNNLTDLVADRPMRITDTVRQGRVVVSQLADTLTITDSYVSSPVERINDTFTVSDDTKRRAGLKQRVVDRPMRIKDVTRQGAAERVVDAFTITDSTQRGLGVTVTVTDGMVIADGLTETVKAVQFVTDSIIIEDKLTETVSRVTESVTDVMTITDTTTEEEVVTPTGHWWTADTRPWAMSRYETSIAPTALTVVDGSLYAITPDGLFVYGEPIDTVNVQVVTGRIEVMGENKQPTHPVTGYFSFNSDNATLTVNDVSYPVNVTNDYEPRRVKIGRGFRQRYYTFKLEFDTVETDLIDFDIAFIDSKRRV